MNQWDLLNKAASGLAIFAGARNMVPDAKADAALGAVANLLRYMDFTVRAEWNEDDTQVLKVIVSFENRTVERTV